eukprot:6147704-Amphidinium_carterae.1
MDVSTDVPLSSPQAAISRKSVVCHDRQTDAVQKQERTWKVQSSLSANDTLYSATEMSTRLGALDNSSPPRPL